MRINSIDIRYFRGFSEKHFDFAPKMNVILGNNTAGKTTLLHAVQIALGAYFQAMTLLPKERPYRRNFKDEDHVRRYSDANKSFLRSPEKPYIETSASFFISNINKNGRNEVIEHTIRWFRNSNNISRKSAGELMDDVAIMEKKRISSDATGINTIFPIILSFGSNRLEKNYRAAQKTKMKESGIEKAYKCALEENVDFKSAFDWIYKYDKNLAKDKEVAGTDTAFLEAVKEAIPAMKHIEIDTKNNEFTALIQMASDPEPKWLTYDMMSDGFKSMTNIVAEIAYRCVELNGFLGADAIRKTPGVVLIDELDLFLHPSWQRHILTDLQNAFPLIQFIVTTHSPFIAQSVEGTNIITLDGKKTDIPPTNRGIEEIVACEMGMEGLLRSKVYRDKQDLAERYFNLVKAGAEGEAETEEVRHQLEKLELEADLYHDPAYKSFLMLNKGRL